MSNITSPLIEWGIKQSMKKFPLTLFMSEREIYMQKRTKAGEYQMASVI